MSEDKKTVTLKIDGLKPGRVVHLRSPRPFSSSTGQELWNTEAWYTLNSLPGYEAPEASGYYEAEEGQLGSGAAIQTEHSGYSGSGFVGGFFNEGANLTFTVNVDAAGTYPVHLRYANGPNPSAGTKTVALYVNGVRQPNWSLPDHGPGLEGLGVQHARPGAAGGRQPDQVRVRARHRRQHQLRRAEGRAGQDICSPATTRPATPACSTGRSRRLTKWRLAGAGSFGRQADCTIRSEGGLGLLWYTAQEFNNYSLKLDWKLVKDDNGGVFVGFPNPVNDPFIAVNQGYEIQIDASDLPDRTTGSIYTFKGADPAAVAAALKPVGQWNAYEIQVQGQTIKVLLNGTLVNEFTSTDPARDLTQGFVGVQNHGGGESDLVPQHPHQGRGDRPAARPGRHAPRLLPERARAAPATGSRSAP